MDTRLNVVITGSSRGIGLALAKKFLSLGDTVIVTSRTKFKAQSVVATLREEFPNAQAFGCACDVCDAEQIENLAQEAAQCFSDGGRIDVWINNAGISHAEKLPLHECSVDTIRNLSLIHI